MSRSICRYYSFSLGCCEGLQGVDVSTCPVVTAGKMCGGFNYLGDIYGDFDGVKGRDDPQNLRLKERG